MSNEKKIIHLSNRKISNRKILVIGSKKDRLLKSFIKLASKTNAIQTFILSENMNSIDIKESIEHLVSSCSSKFDVIINFSALDFGKAINEYENTSSWKKAVNTVYDSLFYSSKSLYSELSDNHGLYVAVTNIGSAFGIEKSDVSNSVGGIVTGFIKGLEKELRPFNCKVIDFDNITDYRKTASMLVKEISSYGKSIEIAYVNGIRKRIITLPAQKDNRKLDIQFSNKDTVLVSGGARGITYECLKALLEHTGCSAIITGRTKMPTGKEHWLNMNEEDLRKYRSNFIREEKSKNSKQTLIEISQKFEQVINAGKIFKNVQKLVQNGFNVKYIACDFLKESEVKNLAEQIKESNQKITGIINGAGLPSFGKVPHKNEKFARKVVDLKANALYLLQHYFVREGLTKFVISMGSISGRFGMDGQVDYSAGADLIVKMSREFSCKYPSVSWKVIGWPAWKSVGMAAVEDVIKVQSEDRGLTFIDIEEGKSHFLKEALSTDEGVEFLYFGNLGKVNMPLGQLEFVDQNSKKLTKELDENGNIINSSEYPMLDKVVSDSKSGLEVEKMLNSNVDVHLLEHVVQRQKVLAGVYHLEASVEVVKLYAKINELVLGKVFEVNNFKFYKFIKYYENRRLLLKYKARLISKDSTQLTMHVQILSDFINKDGLCLIKDRLHSEGVITIKNESTLKNNTSDVVVGGKKVDLNKYYELAKDKIYFGNDFRYLTSAFFNNKDIVNGEITVGDEGKVFKNNMDVHTSISPIVIDNLGRLMLLNEYQSNGNSIIPVKIKRAVIYDNLKIGDKLKAISKKINDNGNTVSYDASLQKDGKILLSVSEMQLHVLEKVEYEHDIRV